MKKYKKIAIIAWVLSLVLWLVTFIFMKDSPLNLDVLFAGLLIGMTIWVNIFFFKPVKYNGALQYDSDVNELTEKWNLVVNGDPSEWPTLDEILLKVEPRKDDI